jgi:hypothetical protein
MKPRNLTPMQNYNQSAIINVVWLKECICYEILLKNEHGEEISRKEKCNYKSKGNKYNYKVVQGVLKQDTK